MYDESLIAEITAIVDTCEAAGDLFSVPPLKLMIEHLLEAKREIGETWSGSWAGYHSSVYLEDFRPRHPQFVFDPDHGLKTGFPSRTFGPWREYEHAEVVAAIKARVRIGSLEPLEDASTRACEIFQRAKEELLPLLDALLAEREDDLIRRSRQDIENIKEMHADGFAHLAAPKSIRSRDALAMRQIEAKGIIVPPHIAFESYLLSIQSSAYQVKQVAIKARHVERYLRRKSQMQASKQPSTESKVFIGHGRATAWKELRDFLRDRLNLDYEEFNRTSAAGLATTERLAEMLDNASFAFLVLTAEDLHDDQTLHARENVIHEAGLFQGRLGFRRAIILLDDDCEEFSNIIGLGQIRFERNNMAAKYDDVRAVLEREGIIPES